MQHGTRSGYVHHGCRCDACTQAQRDYQRTLKERTPPSHGASGYVNYGCRCEVCAEGYRKREQNRNQYKSDWYREKRASG